MADIKSAIIPSLASGKPAGCPLAWDELVANEQAYFDGGQYTSLSSWEADKQGTLTDQHTAELFSFGSAGLVEEAIVIDGSITSATNFFKITSYAPHRHENVWVEDGTKAYLTQTTKVRHIQPQDDYTVIEGMQFKSIDRTINSFVSNSFITIHDNIFNESISTEFTVVCYSESSVISRNKFFGRTNYIHSVISGNLAVSTIVEYNIIHQLRRGITAGYSDAMVLTGNIVLGGSGFCYTGIFDAASDYNVSSDLTAPGTNNVQSFVYATLFPNAATGDFTPAISYLSALGTTWGAGAIPWQRDVLVDTNGGGDYSSLSAAEAGEQTTGDDLVLRNEKMVITCTSGGTTIADTTEVVIDANWNCSKNTNIKVTAASTDRHNGYRDTSKYTLYPTNNLITFYTEYCHFDGLQLYGTRGANQTFFATNTTGAYVTIENCFAIEAVDGSGCYFLYSSNSGYHGTFKNNIIVGYWTGRVVASNNQNITAYNNCIYSLSDGVDPFGFNVGVPSNGSYLYNNIIAGFATDFLGTVTGYGTNISSDGTAPDNSISYTVYDAALDTLPVVLENCVIFKDIVANDFRLVSHFVEDYTGTMVETNSAIGNGTYLADVLDDCAGKSRQPYDYLGVRTQRSFDIGAWQAPVALTYLVDTDGVSGDYSSLTAGFAGLQSDSVDLVTDNLLPTTSCQASTGIADERVIFDGILASEDCFFTAEAAEGHRHNYIWDDSKYSFVYDGWAPVVNIVMDNVVFRFFQVNRIYAAGTDPVISVNVANLTRVTITDCMVTRENTTSYGFSFGGGALNTCDVNVKRNIVYSAGEITTGVYCGWSGSLVTWNIENNIVYGGNKGIDRSEGTAHSINNICVGNTTNDFEGAFATSTNNVSSDLTGNITGLLDTYFVDPANGDFTPVASAGDLTSHGANLDATVSVGAIPFVDEKIVDTGGTGDYTALSVWESVAQYFCVDGETARALCISSSGIADTFCNFDGWGIGVKIEVIGENTTGIWDDTKYRIVTGAGTYCLGNRAPNAVFQYMQNKSIDGGSLGSSFYSLVSISDKPASLLDSLLHCQSDTITGYALNAYYGIIVKNCVLSCSGSLVTPYGAIIRDLGNLFRNVTISGNFGYGLRSYADFGVTAINCAINANTLDFYEPHNVNSSNNVSSDGSAPGSNPTINQDFTGDFVSATDFHTTDSPFELWGVDAAYAGAFGDDPYEILRTVDTDGVSGDEVSLNAAVGWFQTNRADLVLRNEKALITCATTTGVLDANAVTINALTTNEINDLVIRGEGINATGWDTSLYRLDGNSYFGLIRLEVGFVTIRDMQIRNSNGDGTQACIELRFSSGDAEYNIYNNFLLGAAGLGTLINANSMSGENRTVRIYNNVCANGANGITYNNRNSNRLLIANNTIYDMSAVGINLMVYGTNDVGRLQNNIVIDCVDCYYFESSFSFPSISNNISSDADAPGTDSHTGETSANLFVDAAGGNFNLAATATNAIGGGTDLSDTFADDITGATRVVPWDIGPFLYLVGGPTDIAFVTSISEASSTTDIVVNIEISFTTNLSEVSNTTDINIATSNEINFATAISETSNTTDINIVKIITLVSGINSASNTTDITIVVLSDISFVTTTIENSTTSDVVISLSSIIDFVSPLTENSSTTDIDVVKEIRLLSGLIINSNTTDVGINISGVINLSTNIVESSSTTDVGLRQNIPFLSNVVENSNTTNIILSSVSAINFASSVSETSGTSDLIFSLNINLVSTINEISLTTDTRVIRSIPFASSLVSTSLTTNISVGTIVTFTTSLAEISYTTDLVANRIISLYANPPPAESLTSDVNLIKDILLTSLIQANSNTANVYMFAVPLPVVVNTSLTSITTVRTIENARKHDITNVS